MSDNAVSNSTLEATPVGAMRSKWGGLQPVLCSTLRKSPAPSFVLSGQSHRYINPTYVEFLKSLGIDTGKDLAFELKGFKAYTCPNENCGVGGVFLPIISCGRYHPHISHKHSSRCMAGVMEKVEFLEKITPMDYLLKCDLTVPGWVSDSRRSDDLKKLRRAINAFLKKLATLLFHHKSKLGGFYAIHIWKTRKPLEPHLHVHLNLFNVAYNSKDKTFHRFKPFIDHYKVKVAWRDSLRGVGMWDNPVPSFLPDCKVGYLKLFDSVFGRQKLMSRISYCFRRPLIDLNKCVQFCSCWDLTDPIWAGRLLNYVPRQVFVGWAVSLKRFGFRHSPKSILPRCPVCGAFLCYEYRILNTADFPPGIPWLTIDQGGGLVETASL